LAYKAKTRATGAGVKKGFLKIKSIIKNIRSLLTHKRDQRMPLKIDD
jgi:hypothetical protein